MRWSVIVCNAVLKILPRVFRTSAAPSCQVGIDAQSSSYKGRRYPNQPSRLVSSMLSPLPWNTRADMDRMAHPPETRHGRRRIQPLYTRFDWDGPPRFYILCQCRCEIFLFGATLAELTIAESFSFRTTYEGRIVLQKAWWEWTEHCLWGASSGLDLFYIESIPIWSKQ